MKHLKLILLPIFIVLTTGCWNYRELSDLSIVGAIGIDVKDNEFDISVEIINAKKVATNGSSSSSSSDESPIIVYHSQGKTIKEALTNMVLEAPNQLYIGHMNLLVISDAVAREGIKEFIDYLMADTESRKIFPAVVVKNGKAIDALKILMPLETVTSQNIKLSLEAIAKMNGTVSNRLFDEILMCLYIEGREPTITSVEIIGNPESGEKLDNLSTSVPETSIKIDGSAVLKGDKLVGYLDEKESRGYTIIRDRSQTISLSFPCDDKGNYGNIVVDNVKNNLKVNLVNNKPVAEINVTGKAALPEYDCDFDISKSKNILKIQKMADEELKKELKEIVAKVQKEFNSDVFGFGERLYKENNKYWEKNKKNWDKIFPNMDYKIKVNLTIENIDSTIKSAKDR